MLRAIILRVIGFEKAALLAMLRAIKLRVIGFEKAAQLEQNLDFWGVSQTTVSNLNFHLQLLHVSDSQVRNMRFVLI